LASQLGDDVMSCLLPVLLPVPQDDSRMAPLVTLCVLLLLGALGRAQSTRQAQQGARHAPMLPPLPLGDPGSEADLPQFLRSRHAGHLTAENTCELLGRVICKTL